MSPAPVASPFSPLQLRALSAAAFFMAALSWSPLLPGLLSLNSSFAFLGAFFLFALIAVSQIGLKIRLALFCGTLVLVSMILLVATQSVTLWNRTVPLGFIVFAAYHIATTRKLAESVCNLLSVWLLFGVIFSIIGFLYAYSGGEPLLSISNPDGRDNYLYLTTMSGSPIGNVIRPSWVYDEPGAFSFLVCATVALRHILKMKDKLSLVLMLGGLVTLSLTHMLITILFLAFRFGFFKLALLAALLVASAQVLVPELEDFDFVATRFAIEDGRLVGDNRSSQIENFSDVVSGKILLFGDIECHVRPDRTCDEHGDISSSPVTPVYYGGLLFLATQLVVHGALVVSFFRRREYRLPALIISILLLQRPYFAGFGYGLLTYIIIFLMLRGLFTAQESLRGESGFMPVNRNGKMGI